jgi:hypothetical protein
VAITASVRTLFLLAAAALAAPAEPQPLSESRPVFTFRAGFWLHLHHFLCVLGRAEAGSADAGRPAVAGAPADHAQGLQRMTPEERVTWSAAVTTYSRGLSRLDAVFDEPLWRMTAALAPLEEDETPGGRGIPDQELTTLRRAAPIYRRIWWPAHGRASRTRIDELQTWVRLDGEPILAAVTRAYAERWPTGGYPVNLSGYANWAGAYSTGDRLLVLASLDPGLAGSQGLETLIHEAMHQWDEAMSARLSAAARRQGAVRVPEGLSHALVFYTAGEAVRRALPVHVPYAEANGIWRRGAFTSFKEALDRHWRRYLSGQTSLDAALDNVLASLRASR